MFVVKYLVKEVGNILNRLVFDKRVPRREHQQSALQLQEEWKKNLPKQLTKIKQEYPDCDVEVWSMDEDRLGLQPVVRRQWVDEYSNAIAKINWQFQWLWLYGFVHPNSGETKEWILPLVNEKIFSQV